MTASCHPLLEPKSHPDAGRLDPVLDLALDLRVALDLRRRPMPEPVVDAILWLARQIPEPQRRFLEAVLREGRPLSELAARGAQSTSTLRRRYRRIINRLIEPRFGFVVRHRSSWPPQRRLVGTLHLVEGRTMVETARRMGTTVHAVRREVYAIDALLSSQHTS